MLFPQWKHLIQFVKTMFLCITLGMTRYAKAWDDCWGKVVPTPEDCTLIFSTENSKSLESSQKAPMKH